MMKREGAETAKRQSTRSTAEAWPVGGRVDVRRRRRFPMRMAEGARPGGCRRTDRRGGKPGQPHRNAWTKLLMRRSNSGSRLRKVSIFRTEWMTVEWCFPPNALPISGREAAVRVLMRYMAIWRGSATVFELFLALSSVIFTPNWSATNFWIISIVMGW